MSEEKKQEEMQDEELVTEAEGAGESAKSADPEKVETSESGEEAKEDAEKKESTAEEEALNVKYMRLMADFQNFKRRTEKEKSDIYAFANEKIISELLNVIDNFERALLHGAEGDSFAEGMNLIFKQLQGVLEKAGVKEIEALGLDFDPNFHNAVMTEDSTEYESGKVTEVLQKGYTLNSKVIRPSMVKVAN
ncbi:MAG: nucleotide exchange factor GrpE [Anaerovoracaceae bacterium]|nr:nucleotide exchange factor GrpE [Anaerovoracaceae bacterium]